MDNDASLIWNVLLRCEEIEEAMKRFGDAEEDFKDDWMYQYTCSFCLLQIGESTGKLSSELTEKYPEMQWSNIRRTRDFIAHSYHKIDLSIVWMTISEKIPALKKICEKILDEIRRP
jgi:uncharacterized protein with HEPN domain